MTLQERINNDLKNAMINSNNEVKSILRVVIGEINRKEKTLPDDRVIPIIKKMIEDAKVVGKLNEVAILETYLPAQLNAEQLKNEIQSIVTENSYTIKDMGKIMSALKGKFAGKYDGKVANDLIKTILQ
jgi:uncharacterized protein YqeY